MSSMQANQPLPDGYQLENYRIARVLSCGGFSIVYLAYDENLQPVAIKEYLPAHLALRRQGAALPSIAKESAATFRYGLKCFFEEGRSLAGFSHPNVVRVLNFFRANETVYLVMRYERGRTLQSYIEAHSGAVREAFVRRLFAQLLNGLREVHARRLLHLDIKPANIYICSDGRPVLLDFGAARQTLNAGGISLSPMHTPGFAPPEQHRGHTQLGPWSDIYSVGATLYACLAGAGPRPANQRSDRDRSVCARRTWSGQYSRELLHTIDCCLALDPLKRPQSVFALQKLLRGPRRPEPHRAGDLFHRVRGRILAFASR